MPLPIIAGIGAFVLGRSLVSVAARVLAGLGVGFLVLQGLTYGFDQLIIQVQNSFTGIPSDLVGLVALSGADRFISLVLSAYAVSLTLKGVGGTIKRLVFK